MNRKRRQHFVWRKYLEPWSDNGRIWCHRDGRTFRASLNNVALEKDLYTIVELVPEEIKFVRSIFIDCASPMMQDLHKGWIEAFETPFKYRDGLRRLGPLPADIEEQVSVVIHNAEEELHTRIERTALPFLRDLVNGDTSFYENEESKLDFHNFLCTQYTRTPVMKANVLRSVEAVRPKLSRPLTVDFNRIWPLVRHILATNIAYGLHIRSETMRHQLLMSTETRRFITGDQPVVNTLAVGLPEGEAPTALELYYPVSPALALLIAEHIDGADRKQLTDCEVDAFNHAIADQSQGCIYGASRATLCEVMENRDRDNV